MDRTEQQHQRDVVQQQLVHREGEDEQDGSHPPPAWLTRHHESGANAHRGCELCSERRLRERKDLSRIWVQRDEQTGQHQTGTRHLDFTVIRSEDQWDARREAQQANALQQGAKCERIEAQGLTGHEDHVLAKTALAEQL
ncbi:hypothetical protein D3C81_1360320 [compost metagenome]